MSLRYRVVQFFIRLLDPDHPEVVSPYQRKASIAERDQIIRDWEKAYKDLEAKFERTKDPKQYLRMLFQTDISYYDYTELNAEPLNEYKRHAQLLRKNPVFLNEINFLVLNLAKHALQDAANFEELNEMRQKALALKDFENRIWEIPTPEIKDTVPTDPHAAV